MAEVVVGLVQMACSADPQANLAKAVDRVRDAAKRGAELVCLQELFCSPYFCQTEDAVQFELAEPIPGPSTDALGRVAAECGVGVIASLFEKRASGLYHNTAAILAADGSLQGVYRKMHIPDDPAFYEKFYFTPGDTGFVAWPLAKRDVRFGTLVCWDQWFPEAARLTALQGAEMLFYPTAIGWHPKEKDAEGAAQQSAWQTVQRGHAVANGVYVCVVNRIGHELPPTDPSGGTGAGIEFWGKSFVADPMGQVIAEASGDAEETLIVPLDLSKVERARRGWPFLRDRRIDAYDGLLQRFGR